MGKKKATRLQILSGWKDIANYLGKGVRTVQRYEREMGLPIHRPAGKRLAAVIAIQTELDKWVVSGPSRVPSLPKRRALDARTNSLRVNFLHIDTQTALTFSSIALATRDPEKRRHATQVARKAHDTVERLMGGTRLDNTDKEKLEANLQRLKSELESLGQKF